MTAIFLFCASFLAHGSILAPSQRWFVFFNVAVKSQQMTPFLFAGTNEVFNESFHSSQASLLLSLCATSFRPDTLSSQQLGEIKHSFNLDKGYHNWKLTFLIFETVSVKNEFDWSPWSACTRTCGFGSYRTRERTCSLSIARKTCIGSEIQKVLCNVPVCPKMEAARPNAIFRQKSTVNTSRYHPNDFRYIFVVNVELAWW